MKPKLKKQNDMKKMCVWLLILVLWSNTGWSQDVKIEVNIDFTGESIISPFKAGVTHTQKSVDPWGNATSVKNAKLLLDSVTHFQNQHIMGWGTLNPWPDSTVINSNNWNWESLDRRVNLMQETKGEPVITLCASPTWMHTPAQNGKTDWNSIEKAPTKDHYDDFAHLCAEVARRYPDILYYQVWNEFKGFYNSAKNRWDYENYTELYNMVFDSLKAVNPEILIGGPYVVMDSWSTSAISHPSNLKGEYGVMDQRPLDVINYWLQNKKGADFITIDGGNSNKDGVWKTNGFKASQKFVDVIKWIRQRPGGGDSLPVWWAEWYTYPENYVRGNPVDLNYLNAYMAVGMMESIKAGYSTLLIWEPQGDASGLSFPLGIWTNTEISGGGKPTPFYYTQKGLNEYFSEGETIFKVNLSLENVISVLASDSTVLLVNQLNETVNVTIEGYSNQIALYPFEVRFIHYADMIISSSDRKSSVGCHVYPIPFNNQLNIQLEKFSGEQVIIELFSMEGMLVRREELSVDHKNLITVHTGDLSRGVYILKMKDGATTYSKIVFKLY